MPVASGARNSAVGWELIRASCRTRWRGIRAGVVVGLGWTAGKVSVGLLVGGAIDHGIEADDMGALRGWAL